MSHPESKNPDPLLDSVRRPDQLRREFRYNTRFRWSAPLVSRSNGSNRGTVSRSNGSNRWTESESGSGQDLTRYLLYYVWVKRSQDMSLPEGGKKKRKKAQRKKASSKRGKTSGGNFTARKFSVVQLPCIILIRKMSMHTQLNP